MNNTETQPAFTAKEIKDWRACERVRQGGRWNMYDPRARAATGLTREEYGFAMSNYSELKAAAESAK